MTRPIVVLLCWLTPWLVLAQASLEVIEPRHRSAQELVPLLQPLVEPGGSVSAFDNKLVLRATPAQMAEVRQLLASFDRAPRQLLISVRQDGAFENRQSSAGVSGVVRRGDGSIVLPREDGSVPASPRFEARDDRSSGDSAGSQQIRVEEGREAQIMVGQSLPTSSSYRRADGVIVQRTEYSSAGSGFTVLPRLQGQRVQLEIQARQQLPGRTGARQIQNASSIVSGPLGEWFDIGGAVQQVSQSSHGLLGGSEGSSRREGRIMVRVDELP